MGLFRNNAEKTNGQPERFDPESVRRSVDDLIESGRADRNVISYARQKLLRRLRGQQSPGYPL